MDKLTDQYSDILIYQAEDGSTKIDVHIEKETVWLSLIQMAELFQRDKSVISRHIKNIYEEGELNNESTVAFFATVQLEGNREVSRNIEFYNLDVIISVGYRVKSHRGTQFRIWATQRLGEYLIKGFVLDDERLKNGGYRNYFEELLERIRDIRSSEKVFWKKILDIYATSIDYDPKSETSQVFFATVQNKIHWAAHSNTAAEIIYNRADSNEINMGLTNWLGEQIRKGDTFVAKNYLTEKELETLNRIVNLYLEFAELQALNRKPMYMSYWVDKLDDFLRISEREILSNAGKVSHEEAQKKAILEYEKYHKKLLEKSSPVERHFLEAIEKIKKLEEKKD